MCTLIVNPMKAEPVSLEYFLNLWDNNPDGAGFAYVRGNRVEIVKEMKSARALWQRYADVRANTPHPIIIHFRIGTQGGVNLNNTHPFRVHEGLVFAHNGVITSAPYDKNASDTALLVRDVLAKWPKDFITRKGYAEALRYIAGGSNKFAMLDANGRTLITNRHLFHEHKGSLYSNHGYQPATWCNPVTPSKGYYTNTPRDYYDDWHRYTPTTAKVDKPKEGQYTAARRYFDSRD